MKEVFKMIPDYPKYEVSNLGRVRRIKNKRFLKGKKQYCRKSPTGKIFKDRISITLYNDSGRKWFGVHQILFKAFNIRQPSSTLRWTIDHINRDPFDNRLENLRWATPQQQAKNRSNASKKIVKVTMKDINDMYRLTKMYSLEEIAHIYEIDAINICRLLTYMHPKY